MKRFLLATFLSAVVMFLWGSIFWISPFPYKVLGTTKDDAVAGRAILENFPQSGSYIIPGMNNDKATLEQLHQKGPLVFLHVTREGEPMMKPATLGFGFVHEWITCMLMGAIYLLVRPAFAGGGGSRRFILLTGLTAAFFTNLGAPIWWRLPWAFFCVNFIYELLAWVFAGLVLVKMLKPKPLQAGAA